MTGAVVSYVAASMALKLAVGVMIQAVVQSPGSEAQVDESTEDEQNDGERTE